MTKPTPQEFLVAYDPDHAVELWEEELGYEVTEQEAEEQYNNMVENSNFELVEQFIVYGDGPHDVFIIKDKRTGQHYRTFIYHDSWSGVFDWEEAEFEEVVKVLVTKEEWETI